MGENGEAEASARTPRVGVVLVADRHLVAVEAHVGRGLPSLTLTGLRRGNRHHPDGLAGSARRLGQPESARAGPEDRGPDYKRFWVQRAETFREYTWENGQRIDGDLTSLFIERQP
jgi:hypothetical protein